MLKFNKKELVDNAFMIVPEEDELEYELIVGIDTESPKYKGTGNGCLYIYVPNTRKLIFEEYEDVNNPNTDLARLNRHIHEVIEEELEVVGGFSYAEKLRVTFKITNSALVRTDGTHYRFTVRYKEEMSNYSGSGDDTWFSDEAVADREYDYANTKDYYNECTKQFVNAGRYGEIHGSIRGFNIDRQTGMPKCVIFRPLNYASVKAAYDLDVYEIIDFIQHYYKRQMKCPDLDYGINYFTSTDGDYYFKDLEWTKDPFTVEYKDNHPEYD